MKIKFQAMLRDGYECELTVTDTTKYQHAGAPGSKDKAIILVDEKTSTIIPLDKIQYIRLKEVAE